MWYKVKELKSKGLHCAQIAHELGLHRHTVEKYVRMSLEEFQASQAYERDRICIYNLDKLAIDKKESSPYLIVPLRTHPYLVSISTITY